MKLLILTTQDRFFLSHITERAEYFRSRGWEVSVAIQVTDVNLVQKIIRKGFEVFDTKIERQSVNPFSQITALFRLVKIYFKVRPDLVWHLGAKPIAYGTLVTRLLRFRQPVGIVNAPIGLGFVYASSSLKARLLRPIVNFLYRLSLNPRFSRVIIENNDDIEIFVSKGLLNRKDAFCILGAGVDTDCFSPINKRNPICTVLMACRLIKEKGVWDFVEVANRLYKKRIPVKMVLVGEPDYGNPSSITREEFCSLKENPSLICLGYKDAIQEEMKKSDIFVLPSFYREGLPRVLVEAASCGLPILTTDTIGCREVVRDDNGFLFKAHDINNLEKLIMFFVNNPNEVSRMGANSREVALKYFDTRKICSRTYKVFQKLYDEVQNG